MEGTSLINSQISFWMDHLCLPLFPQLKFIIAAQVNFKINMETAQCKICVLLLINLSTSPVKKNGYLVSGGRATCSLFTAESPMDPICNTK